MDFSTPRRALESLNRRVGVDERTKEIAKELLAAIIDEPQTDSSATDKDERTALLGLLVELLTSPDSSSTIATSTAAPDVSPSSVVSPPTARWEGLAVGLYLATEWIITATLTSLDKSGNVSSVADSNKAKIIYVDGPRVPAMKPGDTSSVSPNQAKRSGSNNDWIRIAPSRLNLEEKLVPDLRKTVLLHLEHKEPRVRTLVAKAVGALVGLMDDDDDDAVADEGLHAHIVTSLLDHLAAGRDESNQNYSKSSTGALDDTTGWRALETNWQALAAYVAADSGRYWKHHPVTNHKELLEACEYSCVTHVNRHVRAAGIQVLEQWLLCAAAAGIDSNLLTHGSPLRQTTVNVLKVTLADNWSQVRMAASVLCRTFWTVLLKNVAEEDQNLDALYPILVPRMCLNRFYLAQGVKLYSLTTWQQVFSGKLQGVNWSGSGLEVVAKCSGAMCRYYAKMADADNHVVREAACQAIAELASRIGSHPGYAASLAPYVTTLLQALLMCFLDESWPVRDEACLACGKFCRAYPEECRSELPLLKERWMEQLTDQIWSVREDAAVALGDAVLAYPAELWEDCLTLVRAKLPAAREQEAMTMEEYKAHQNNIDMHTDSQLYSCGSLAPKLRKGGAGRIGCSSCGITRPKAPWEATDGCIYLIRELILKGTEEGAAVIMDDETLMPLLTELVDVCRVKHFPQADDLRATLWRQLPIMARALGKTRFKRHYLFLFLDLMMNTLDEHSHASALSRHAAGQCASELATLVGPSIFRGRLDDIQRDIYDAAMQERARMPRGPDAVAAEHGFSPFGPPAAGATAFQGGSGNTHPAVGAAAARGMNAPPVHPHNGIPNIEGGVRMQQTGIPGGAFMDTL